MEDAGPAVEPERDDRRRQIGGEGGRAVLVVDEAELALPVRQAQRGGDDVGAVGSAQPTGAHDRRPGSALPLPCQLRCAVDGGWVRRVPLTVRSVGGSVKDVVGGHVDQVRPDLSGRLRDVTGADGVHGEGGVDLGLTTVDGGERTSVQHEFGLECGEGLQNGIPVVDAHGVDVGREDLVVASWTGSLRSAQRATPAACRHPPGQDSRAGLGPAARLPP